MSTQKYIGARYMPKFMGTYDATTAYEALSVVDNGAGTTYVSNKPTPAGTPLTDADYWSVYGASSGAILDLQNRMGTAENNITSLQGAVSDLDDDNDIYDAIVKLKGKTIAVFGSSNEIGSNTQGTSWVDSLTTLLSGYATVINNSVGGVGIYDSITAYIADDDKATYDIVIFCSTRNQYKNQVEGDIGKSYLEKSGIETAIDSLSAYKLITQEFYFASCIPYTDAKKGIPMCIYDGMVKRACCKNGYNMLDMHSWFGVSDDNSASIVHDTLHLYAAWAPIVAEKALKAMAKGGEPFANYPCIIRNADLMTYLQTYANLASGIDRYNLSNSELYCDVDCNVRLAAYLHNNTGAQINANTAIIDTQGVSCILTSTNFYSQEYETNLDFVPLRFTARSTQLRNLDAIAANANFLIVKAFGLNLASW